MNLSRRGILGMLAAGVGAAIVRPGLLMPIKPALVRAPYDPAEYERFLAERLANLRKVADDVLVYGRSQMVLHDGGRFEYVPIDLQSGTTSWIPADVARLGDAFERGRASTWVSTAHTGKVMADIDQLPGRQSGAWRDTPLFPAGTFDELARELSK